MIALMVKSITKPKKNHHKPSAKMKLFGVPFVLKWGLTFFIWGVVIGGGVLAFFAYDLPSIDDALADIRRPSVTILSADGRQIARSGDIKGAAVQLRHMATHLPLAVIATEDRRFYDHFGIDLIGIGRAMWINIRAGRIRQGGSTITQQAAKNLFLTPERTLKRKVQEVLLALWLEHKFSKDQILTIYLNRVYFGAGAYGVSAAARLYFGVPVSQLSLHQSAVLAGLLKAPSRLSPRRNPKGAARRARVVLANMAAAGYLTEATAKTAGRRKINSIPASPKYHSARYFADWIVEQVAGYVGPGSGDIVVRTTLDADLQKFAEAELDALLARQGAKSGVRGPSSLTLGVASLLRGCQIKCARWK